MQTAQWKNGEKLWVDISWKIYEWQAREKMFDIIRKMRAKTTVTYCCTPSRMSGISKSDHTNCWQGCGGTETHTLLVAASGGGIATLENSFKSSQKGKHTLTMWPRNSCRYLFKRAENIVLLKTCVWVFIASLFTIANN